MKKILFALISFSTFSLAQAQNHSYTPSKSEAWTIAPDIQSEMKIHIKNTGLSPLTITYKIIGNTLPSGWYSSICDNNVCWDPLPVDTTNFAPIQPNEDVFLKLQVTPNNKKGTGVVKIRVNELGNKSKYDTLTYTVNLLWNSSVKNISSNTLTISPNPAKDIVVINGVVSKTPYSVYNLSGKQLICGILNQNAQKINISALSPGVYFVQTQTTGLPKQTQRLVVE